MLEYACLAESRTIGNFLDGHAEKTSFTDDFGCDPHDFVNPFAALFPQCNPFRCDAAGYVSHISAYPMEKTMGHALLTPPSLVIY